MTSTTTPTTPKSATVKINMAGSTLVKALEDSYKAVRKSHPDLPEVVFITGTGLMGRGAKWGHYGADRWVKNSDGTLVDAETGRLPEIFIAGERLACGAQDTFQTLLHEAVHALARVRDIQETSRGHRYHNRRFVALSEELGLEFPEGQAADTTIGFSAVVLTKATIESYAQVIAKLDAAICAHLDTFERLGLTTGKGTGAGTNGTEAPTMPKKAPKENRSNLKATCGCEEPRIIRASAKVLEEAPITCSLCGEVFAP